ncbi:MAG TPA: hypothetical protein VKV26_04245 [Dehalococcoidia bacterium]|nr:hypothetical protein [Dehalococcoidia bacterium]
MPGIELRSGGEPFRCVYDPPATLGSRVCLIVQSGQAGPIDEPTTENRLYERLGLRLSRHGAGTIRFEMQHRADRHLAASPAEFAERVRRLESVLAAPDLQPLLPRTVLLGASLGADVVLAALSSKRAANIRLAGLVLIGCVIEAPVRLRARVGAAAFVYGAGDYVAYVDAAGNQTAPRRPADYAPATLRRLAGVDAAAKLHILDGLGHTLAPCVEMQRAPDPVPLLTRLVLRTCAGHASPDGDHRVGWNGETPNSALERSA